MAKILYVIYNNLLDDVELITASHKEAVKFIDMRIYDSAGNLYERAKNMYKLLRVEGKDNIKKLLDRYQFHYGEMYGGILFSQSEFEMLSEYMSNVNSTLLYDMENKIFSNLKYLKICDEDKELIEEGINILIDKINLIECGPPDDSEIDIEVFDEEYVYDLEKLVQQFFKDMIAPNPYRY
jgi:hypothetical protein